MPVGLLHHDEVVVAEAAEVVNGKDVGVLEVGGEVDLLAEGLQRVRLLHGARGFRPLRGEAVGEDLQGDDAVQLGVQGAVDDARRGRPELAQDAVAAECLADELPGALDQLEIGVGGCLRGQVGHPRAAVAAEARVVGILLAAGGTVHADLR